MGEQSDKYLLPFNNQTIECDRVTNVLGATKGSGGLATWYGREERKAWKEAVLSAAPPEKAIPAAFGSAWGQLEHFVNSLTDDDDDLFASRKRDNAGDAGSNLHALISHDAKGTQVTEHEWYTWADVEKFHMWDKFRRENGIEYVDSEKRVYSPNLMVAGTLDVTFMWKGVMWLGDFKTGTLRRDAAVQMVTYWVLREETLAIENKVLDRQREFTEAYAQGGLPVIEWPRFGIIHIDDDGLEFYEVDLKLPDLLARNFLYRLQAYRDDQILRPFRRMYPPPKILKNGTVKEPIWLRAS